MVSPRCALLPRRLECVSLYGDAAADVELAECAGLASAAQEIRGLEALEYQMSGDVHTLRQRRADGKFEQTLLGRLVNWSGLLFALYCVFRFVAVCILPLIVLPCCEVNVTHRQSSIYSPA